MSFSPVLEIDLAAEAAYLRLSESEVHITKDVSDAVIVDLDEYGVVVGIEILDLDTTLPTERLIREHHVHSDQLDAVKHLRESPKTFMLKSAAQGTSVRHDSRKMQFC